MRLEIRVGYVWTRKQSKARASANPNPSGLNDTSAVRDAHSGSHRVYTGVLERVERTLRMRDELEHAIVLVIELASDLVELWAHNLRSRQRGYPCSA